MTEGLLETKGAVLDVRRANYGKRDHEIFTIHAYALGLESLHSVVDLPCFQNLQTLSLHNNNISRIERLESLGNLTELNLSSNNLQAIQGLSQLSALQTLNLASNAIQRIEGLQGLTALRKLVLSHNQIASLDGLAALHGPRFSLTSLDLRDNLIASLNEVWVLAGLPKLSNLVFSAGHQDNPVCHVMNYRHAVVSALPGLQTLDGTPTRQLAVAAFLNRPPETQPWPQQTGQTLPQPPETVSRTQPGAQTLGFWGHDQTGYEVGQWPDAVRIGLAGLPVQSERAASGAFASTSFTPTIDHALQGFYRRQQQRGCVREVPSSNAKGGVIIQGGSVGSDPHHRQPEYVPSWNLTRGVSTGVSGSREGSQAVENQVPDPRFSYREAVGVDVDRGETFHTNREQRVAGEYENRIGVLESRLLDLAEKVEREGARNGDSETDRRVLSKPDLGYRSQAPAEAGVDTPEEKDHWKRRKGEVEMAGETAPRRQEARPRVLIHGQGGQEGKNKIANAGTQRLLALVNERKNTRKGPLGSNEPPKLRTVVLSDEATQTSSSDDFRVSRLTSEADALRGELEVLSAELAKRDAADAKMRAVAALEKEEMKAEREKATDAFVRCGELEDSLRAATREREEERAAWEKKEREQKEALVEAEKRVEATAHSLESARESITRLEAQILAAKAEAVSDAVETVRRELADVRKELSDVRGQKLASDGERAAAVTGNKMLEAELKREKNEREKDWERARTATEEARKKMQAALANAEASRVGEAAAREEARRLAAALALCHEDHHIAINHLKELHSQEVQNLVEREAAHATEKVSIERNHALALQQLEARVRDLEAELQKATQDKTVELQRLQSSLEAAVHEGDETRRALRTSLRKESQAEGLVAELTEVVRRQKARIEALQTEREQAEPRRGEVSALRKKVEHLTTREADLARQLSEKGNALAATDADLVTRTTETRDLAAALAAAQEEGRRRCEEGALLKQRLELAEDKVKIKDKMLDSQNASLADLKAEVSRLKVAHREAEEAAARAAAEWKERLRDEIEQGRALRAELESQDRSLADLEEKLEAERAAAKRAAADARDLKAKLDEKDGVLRFVEQEVDRVKGLFDTKERALVADRDAARTAARAAETTLREALGAGESDRKAQQEQMDQLKSECQVLRKASADLDTALAQARADCERRVSEVEQEMRALLLAMERQKAKAAARAQQLSAFVEELQRGA